MQQSVHVSVAVAVASLLVACGEVGKVPASDGNTGDDGPPPLPVTVTVLTTLGNGAPDPTAKVLFQDPDGAVVSDVMVDATGHAQAMLPRGGSVSAIRITSDATNLTASITTTLGVKPGDDLTFGLKASAANLTQGGVTTMTAMFPPVTGATLYRFFTSCGQSGTSTTSPVTLSFHDSCHGAMFDVLGTTTVGGVPQYLHVTNVTYANGATTNLATVFNPMPNFTVNMMNVPDPVSLMSVSRTTLLNNTPTISTSGNAFDPPVGNVSTTVLFPQGVGTRSELSITMSRDDAMINQKHEVHTATLGTSASVDIGQQKLPWFTNLAQTATGATWTMVVPGDPPDGMMVNWSGSWNDGTRPVSVSWLITQSAQMAGVTLPKLPAAYTMIDPGQQTVTVKPTSVTLGMADYDNLASYDQFRQMPETLLISSNGVNPFAVTPIGVMGAFVGMPFQRRIMIATVNAP